LYGRWVGLSFQNQRTALKMNFKALGFTIGVSDTCLKNHALFSMVVDLKQRNLPLMLILLLLD
jgi:hypothetical protein